MPRYSKLYRQQTVNEIIKLRVKLAKKKLSEREIFLASIQKFLASKREHAEAHHPLYMGDSDLRTQYNLYMEARRQMNLSDEYRDVKIVGKSIKFTDKDGKKKSVVIETIGEGDDLLKHAEERKPSLKGIEDEIEQSEQMGSDPEHKKRIRRFKKHLQHLADSL